MLPCWIHSRHDHAPHLREIEGAANQAWDRCRKAAKDLRTWEDFHQAMAAWAAPALALSAS